MATISADAASDPRDLAISAALTTGSWPCLTLTPFLGEACRAGTARVREVTATTGGMTVDCGDVVGSLVASMLPHLAMLASRTVGGGLSREAWPRDYADQIDWLGACFARDGASEQFWAAYPVILDRVTSVLDSSIEALTGCLRRLRSDLTLLRRTFGMPLDHLTQCRLRGDPHVSGGVLELRFRDSTLYYKPRSLALDLTLDALCCAVGEGAGLTPPRVPQSVVRKGYAWQLGVRWVRAPHPDDVVSDAYRQQVAVLLAASSVLRSVDLHSENAIYDGTSVALVDAECSVDAAPAEWAAICGVLPGDARIDPSLMADQRPTKTAWAVRPSSKGLRFHRRPLAPPQPSHLPFPAFRGNWSTSGVFGAALADSLAYVKRHPVAILNALHTGADPEDVPVRKITVGTTSYSHLLWLLGDVRAGSSRKVAADICKTHLVENADRPRRDAEVAALLEGCIPKVVSSLAAMMAPYGGACGWVTHVAGNTPINSVHTAILTRLRAPAAPGKYAPAD